MLAQRVASLKYKQRLPAGVAHQARGRQRLNGVAVDLHPRVPGQLVCAATADILAETALDPFDRGQAEERRVGRRSQGAGPLLQQAQPQQGLAQENQPVEINFALAGPDRLFDQQGIVDSRQDALGNQSLGGQLDRVRADESPIKVQIALEDPRRPLLDSLGRGQLGQAPGRESARLRQVAAHSVRDQVLHRYPEVQHDRLAVMVFIRPGKDQAAHQQAGHDLFEHFWSGLLHIGLAIGRQAQVFSGPALRQVQGDQPALDGKRRRLAPAPQQGVDRLPLGRR